VAAVAKINTLAEGVPTVTPMTTSSFNPPPSKGVQLQLTAPEHVESIVLAFLDLGYISHSVTLSVHLRRCGIQAFLLLCLPAREAS
jgi:hypothetical protein